MLDQLGITRAHLNGYIYAFASEKKRRSAETRAENAGGIRTVPRRTSQATSICFTWQILSSPF